MSWESTICHQACPHEELEQVQLEDIAEGFQFDNVDSAFARLALGNERRINIQTRSYFLLRKADFLANLS